MPLHVSKRKPQLQKHVGFWLAVFGVPFLSMEKASARPTGGVVIASDKPTSSQNKSDATNVIDETDSLAVTAPLSRYKTPTEVQLLREVGLEAGPEIDAAVDRAMLWVSQSFSAAQRAEFVQKCEQQVNQFNQGSKLTVEALQCVPWAIEKFNTGSLARREVKGPVRFVSSLKARTEGDWKNRLRGLAYWEALARIEFQSIPELTASSQIAARLGADCQYRGALAAVIARAEVFFPNPTAMAAVESVYPAAFACLEPDDDGFERTHLRMGLFRLMQGDIQRARQSLLLAAHAENPEEEFRSLFWLGVIEERSGARKSANAVNEHWEMLRKRYPLVLHSVVAAHTSGIDPLLAPTSNKDPNLSRRVGTSWSEFNLAAFFFEFLTSRKAANHLTAFAKYAARLVDAPNSEALLFLAHSYSTAQLHRVTIASLTRYFRETQSQGVTLDTLNMFFPRAYTDQIMSSAGVVDPVIVLSLIRQESAFDPFARSVADARGLMQLLPSTASKWLAHSHRELFDPSQNVRVGVKYMETLFKRYDGNVEHVLAAYNAGFKNLDKWKQRFPMANALLFMDLIPFKETRTYVAIILRNAYWYGRLMTLHRDQLADELVRKSSQAKWKSATVHNLLRIAENQDAGKSQWQTALSELYSLPKLSQ